MAYKLVQLAESHQPSSCRFVTYGIGAPRLTESFPAFLLAPHVQVA